MFKHHITNLFKRLGRQHARYVAKRHLREIDDYLLRDIGIDRSQIDSVVDGMLAEPPHQQPYLDGDILRTRRISSATTTPNCGVMISSIWSAAQPLSPSRRTG
ncbi:MAG: DUF1127 domain-containing protein [Rhodospirillaceae bacterium]|jgi:uncharacterized protein YjiS (DUF1127 family)|nr:DUF1127 domain-containing protein [Rhodospirillaceae bacterium]